MSIFRYELIAPVTDRKKPYIDNNGYFIIPNIGKYYTHYIEAARYDPRNDCYNFFLLLGTNKFDEQCRTCRIDDYARLKLFLHNNFRKYVINEIAIRGNVECTYLESENNYDVFQIS